MIVSFHALAERELNDAAQYYEMESQGLGLGGTSLRRFELFLRSVHICRLPRGFSEFQWFIIRSHMLYH